MEIKQADVSFERELFDNLGNVTDYEPFKYTAYFLLHPEVSLLIMDDFKLREIKTEFKDVSIEKLLYPNIIELEGGKVHNFQVKLSDIEPSESFLDCFKELQEAKTVLDAKCKELDELNHAFQVKEFQLAKIINENKNTI